MGARQLIRSVRCGRPLRPQSSCTAEQLAPPGGEQPEQLAMVVSEVFHEPTPDAAVAGQATLLEALQTGIVGKLAVLDDPDITGTGSRRRNCWECRAGCWRRRWPVIWYGRSWSAGLGAGRWRRWLTS